MDDDTIIEDIRAQLKPMKRGSGDLRKFIDGTISLAKVVGTIPPTTAKAISNPEKRFKKAIAILEDLGDGWLPSDVPILPILKTYAKQRISGRRDPLQEFCAFQAAEMVAHLSSRPLTSTENGPVRNIAKIIFEAATGRPTTDTALLKAVRREVARRKKPQ